MAELLRDVRHALRTLAGQRTFTLTALATLALGIGANTAMFSIVYGVLLRPLPYPDPDALVRVGQLRGRSRSTVALDNRTLPLIQEQARSFEELAAYGGASFEWASPAGTVTLRGARVSPSMFPLLRATPHLGRFFTEEEARVGADRVAVLSHGAWTRRFGSDPNIVGSVLDVDDAPFTVIGVAAEGFYFPTPDSEIWTPHVIPAFTPPDPEDDRRMVVMIAVTVLGRLRPGVSPEQATTEVRTLLQGNETEFSTALRAATRAGPSGDTPEIDAQVVPLHEEMVGEYRPALLALTAAMALVLLIACTNVAGLLLARGVTRQRSLAVCAALGAGRSRIVRQLLTESVVLGLIGGALGLAAAAVVLRVVPALVPGNVARLDEVGIDGAVLAFTLGLSVVVGLAFGAVPAFQWSRLPLVRVLNEGSAQSAGGFRLLRSSRTRAALATAQVALALVLLVGAGLLLRSFVGLLTVDRGYDPANVITAHSRNPDLSFRPDRVTPEVLASLRTASQRHQVALLEAMDRIERLPDVASVGVSSGLPLAAGGGTVMPLRVVGRPAPADANESPRAVLRVASPGYFEVLRMRLREGRFYSRLDGAGSPRVAVVNETFARETFGSEPAVGQRLRFLGPGTEEDPPWEVVGVVADVRYGGLAVTESSREVFVSTHQMQFVQVFSLPDSFLAVRTIGDPLTVVPFLAEAVAEAHPRATIDNVMTLEARLSAVIEQPRFYAGFVGFFAGLALFLAAFGIYALLTYTVEQRRREIGVRMALGAQRSDIVGLVVRQGAMLLVAGAALGLLAAAASSRVLESFLYGIATDDRLTFVGAPLALAAVGLFACWLPAQRATRIDPMDALRVE